MKFQISTLIQNLFEEGYDVVAEQVTVWKCPNCSSDWETEKEADFCCWQVFEFKKIDNVHVGVNWREEVFWMEFTLHTLCRGDEVILRLKEPYGMGSLEILDVISCPSWFTDEIMDVCPDKLIQCLNEEWDKIEPLVPTIEFVKKLED